MIDDHGRADELLETARRLLVVRTSAQLEQRLWEGALNRAARRRRRRKLLQISLPFAGLLLLFGTAAYLTSIRTPSPAMASAPKTPNVNEVTPGLTIVPLAPSDYRFSSARPGGGERSVVELRRGSLRFVARPPASGNLVVRVGDLDIEDVGTEFEVSADDAQVNIKVIAGLVRLAGPDAKQELRAGSEKHLERRSGAGAAPTDDQQPAPKLDVDRWRHLAQQGQFKSAYESAQAHGAGAVRDQPEDRLLWADVLRLSGHAAAGAEVLRDFLKRYPKDPRATTAAFTLGRVLMDELNRPSQAAAAFVDAERLAGRGALAEDALARATLAYARAGDNDRARECATRYVARFPQGRHRTALAALLGPP